MSYIRYDFRMLFQLYKIKFLNILSLSLSIYVYVYVCVCYHI